MTVHNLYQQAGGEDTVHRNEAALLQRSGHEVHTLTLSNDAIASKAARAATAFTATYNRQGKALAAAEIARFRPDVVHVHNTFPRFSPAVFDACSQAGVPVVWTLHNFRVACASAIFMRDGAPCEACLGKAPVPAIRHRCYRGSAIGSASVAAMIWTHQLRGTWRSKVDRFVALTGFAREKFIAAGLPSDRIVVKPNFAEDPLVGASQTQGARTGALFVGRLSPEKGAAVLVRAWRDMGAKLTILGDGPERAALEAAAGPEVTFLGHRDRQQVQQAMRSAQLLVVPSTWFEMYPMTVVEAMACGTPVVASGVGALAEIVTNGETGYHFPVGDAQALRMTLQAALADPTNLGRLGANARSYYEDRLAPGACLSALEDIYMQAMDR